MKKTIAISVLLLALMEGISWWAYKSWSSQGTDEPSWPSEEKQVPAPLSNAVSQQPIEKPESIPPSDNQTSTTPETSPADLLPKGMGSSSSEGSFPLPSTEVVNGVTERTIHMGVRQYEWDPKIIRAKQGELVRLIIHNADVKHGIAIPELGVNEDISPDGAVVTFQATKKGTFEFFCSVWCGEGHMEMTAKLVIE